MEACTSFSESTIAPRSGEGSPSVMACTAERNLAQRRGKARASSEKLRARLTPSTGRAALSPRRTRQVLYCIQRRPCSGAARLGSLRRKKKSPEHTGHLTQAASSAPLPPRARKSTKLHTKYNTWPPWSSLRRPPATRRPGRVRLHAELRRPAPPLAAESSPPATARRTWGCNTC